MNFADKIKKQTDRILRMQRINGSGTDIIKGDTGGGGGPQVINIGNHNHDSRYYTKAQADAKYALLSNTPKIARQAFTAQNSIVFAHNLGKHPLVQVVGSIVSAYGAGNYGAGNYGGMGDVVMMAPSKVAHDSVNQVTVTLGAAGTGEVICVG